PAISGTATRVEPRSMAEPPLDSGATGVAILTEPTFAGAEHAGASSVPIPASAAPQTAWPSIAAWSSRPAPPSGIESDLALEGVGSGAGSGGSLKSTLRKGRVRELALAWTRTEGVTPTKSQPVALGSVVAAPVSCSGSW